ncbi:MAG: GNAT family N-acetyltransferase [Erysipelotrichaceae bacterium]|nr:GNAT family N-acetyltransferase [Erysipelotrichaceae bacterium]
MNFFAKLFKKRYTGDVVDLVEDYRVDERNSYDGVPTIYYKIYLHDSNDKVGKIELRLSIEGDNIYYGHVGYNINRDYRGHHYAYEACKILFKIAREEFAMSELLITCSPENIASYKTLKKLNGELIDLVKVPTNHMLYILGEKTKYIFKYKINLD